MKKSEHKVKRLRSTHAVAHSPQASLDLVRGLTNRNLFGKQAGLPAHPFNLKKQDLEILLLLRITPGLSSRELYGKVELRTYPRVVARRLVILHVQDMVRCRTVAGVRRWYLADAGFDAVQMIPA